MTHAALLLATIILTATGLAGCDSGQPGPGTKAGAPDAALSAPAASPARMDNDEGVSHYQQGHWDVALAQFRKAEVADPGSAVVQYNIALTLDKMGKHEEATAAFKKALDLAPADSPIRESEILKKHVGM